MSIPAETYQILIEGGKTGDEIAAWERETRQMLTEGGVPPVEIEAYFGQQPVDDSQIRGVVDQARIGAEAAEMDVVDYLSSGLKASSTGMVVRQALPEFEPTADTPWWGRAAFGLASLVGDFPFMVVGAEAGAAAGGAVGGIGGTTALPGPGTITGAGVGAAVGGAAGAFALPAFVRSSYTQMLEAQQVTGPKDYAHRVLVVANDTAKAAVTGAAIAPVAGAAKVLAPGAAGATRVAAKTAEAALEVGTLATVQAGLEGHLPTGQEFMDAAILIGGLKATGAVRSKLYRTYERIGLKPAEIAKIAENDPSVKQQILSKDPLFKEPPDASKLLAERFKTLSKEDVQAEFFIDPGTGILNERGFKMLEPTAEKPLVGHISVEGVKWYNDNWGHSAGDNIYKLTAEYLHAIDPQAAKVGGDFAVRVKDQAELDAIVAKLNETFPMDLQITGAVGETFKIAGEAHGAMKAAAEAGGIRAERGTTPKALAEKGFTDKTGKAPEVPEGKSPEFTIPEELTGKLEAMAPEDVANTMYVESSTGNLTGQAYHALPKKQFQVSIDLNGLKWGNNKLGEAAGDEFLRKFGLIANELKLEKFDFAHLHGDEYVMQGSSEVELGQALSRLTQAAETIEYVVTDANGVPYLRKGHTFGSGIGRNYEQADARLNRHKTKLTRRGKRGNRIEDERTVRLDANDPRVRPQPAGGDAAGGSGDLPQGQRIVLGAREGGDTAGIAESGAAVSQVLERISRGEKDKKRRLSWSSIYQHWVDRNYPLKKLDDILLGPNAPMKTRSYIQARLLAGAAGKIESYLQRKPFDAETLRPLENTKSYREVLESVDDLDGFAAYLTAKHSIEREAAGLKTGVDQTAARTTVAELEGKYGQAAKDLYAYQDALLNYLKTEGILSEEAVANFQSKYDSYVPLYRQIEGKTQGGAGRGAKVKQPIKRAKGGEQIIVDPLESIVRNTHMFLEMAERNRVWRTLVEAAEGSEAGAQFVKRVPEKMKPFELTEKELEAIANGMGADTAEFAEGFTIFRRASGALKENEIAVFRNGKREVYEVEPEVAEIWKGMDQQAATLVTKILRFPAQTLRAGAVLTPEFASRNIIRDAISSFVYSGGKALPFTDFGRGVASAVKKDAWYDEWLKSGGANATLVSMDRRYLQHNLEQLHKQTGLFHHAQNVVKHPIEFMRLGTELLENSTRIGAFKREAGSLENIQDINALQKAAMESREITLDFARMGMKMRAYNQVIAFLNAQVQGTDKMVRAMRDNPKATAATIAAGVVAPSVMLWAVNHDDQRYKDLPQWQKDMFWIFMTDDWKPVRAPSGAAGMPEHLVRVENGQTYVNEGTVWRIPKPFEFGLIFGSGTERMLDAMIEDDPKAFEGFISTVGEGFMPSVVPTGAVPVLEAYFNKSLFTGGPIIPYALEDQLPEYQYRPYTTELAKKLGTMIGALPTMKDSKLASPIIIENTVRGWTGGLGNYAIQLADKGLREAGVLPDPIKPAGTLADYPVVKAFVVRHPSSGAEPITQFYDKYEKNTRRLKTIKRLAKEGNVRALMKEAELSPQALFSLDQVQSAMGQINRYIQLIHQSQDMTEDDKRQLIDSAYYQLIEIAKAGNTMVDAVEEATKDFTFNEN